MDVFGGIKNARIENHQRFDDSVKTYYLSEEERKKLWGDDVSTKEKLTIDDLTKENFAKDRQQGLTMEEIAKKYGVSTATLYNRKKGWEMDAPFEEKTSKDVKKDTYQEKLEAENKELVKKNDELVMDVHQLKNDVKHWRGAFEKSQEKNKRLDEQRLMYKRQAEGEKGMLLQANERITELLKENKELKVRIESLYRERDEVEQARIKTVNEADLGSHPDIRKAVSELAMLAIKQYRGGA